MVLVEFKFKEHLVLDQSPTPPLPLERTLSVELGGITHTRYPPIGRNWLFRKRFSNTVRLVRCLIQIVICMFVSTVHNLLFSDVTIRAAYFRIKQHHLNI